MSNFLTRNLIESDSGYLIERSLRFMAASSQYLTRTFGTPALATTFTVSAWVKRGKLGATQTMIGASAVQFDGLIFNTSDQLVWFVNGVATITTTAVFRDPSAYYHIVLKCAGASSILYVNGVQVGSGIVASVIFNTAIQHIIGQNSGTNYLDGYIAEFISVDGQALTPSSFGEINTATGQWVAKRYAGTYGTNGFYLPFDDGTSTTTLGNDYSGNGNNWTLTNFTRSAGVNDCWMKDVPAGNGDVSSTQPSGNYCVLNPLHKSSGMSTSNANLTAVSSSTSQVLGSTFAVNSGKWYWEAHIVANNAEVIGVIDLDDVIASTAYPGATVKSYGVYPFSGTKYNNGSGTAYTAAYVAGVVGVKLDLDAGTISFTKLGVDQGVAYSGLTGYKMPACGDLSAGADFTMAHNFGQREFTYSVPSGYKALCTANLPTPAIKKSTAHWGVQLSTGANIKTDSEALFTNEFEWIKDRANVNNHQLIDSVRGSTAVLQSNTTAAETTYTAPSGSSVGWVWRASDSAAVTNTDGSISSQVSANPTAGFSIVTHTNAGVAGTIGHGLGNAPKLIINKVRNRTENWRVYFGQANKLLILNATNAEATDTTIWNNTQPTSSVFSIGAYFTGGDTVVSYCFAEIPGYSKFGSYTGNGSADGTNATLGFTPAFIMFKRTDAASAWVIYDATRDLDNPADLYIQAQSSAAEASAVTVDLNSNGFKLRTTGDPNVSGGTYIYMAFAKCPFNYANAR